MPCDVNLLNKFNQTLGFTPAEGRVVVFLAASFVIGLGIKFVRDTTNKGPQFDYATADSEFVARSRQTEADSTDDNDNISVGQQVKPLRKESDSLSFPVDINIATQQELVGIPGIGETMAGRIVQYRKEEGKFVSLEELMKVKGVGKKKFERIKPYCTIHQ